MKILKQIVGVDVAQKELVVAFGRLKVDLSMEIVSTKVFPNNAKGFDKLISWTKPLSDDQCPVQFVMEATGVYHEKFAYHLFDTGIAVSVILPNKISSYFKTLDVKTITDSTAAQAITRFGIERRVELWKRPKPVFKTLKQLTRERDQIVLMRTMAKNHLHAELAEAEPGITSVKRIKDQITMLDSQEKLVRKEITKIAQKPELTDAIKVITSIPGIALLTAVTVLGETNGFELIRNRKQLTSYAGLDVREKQSGTSVRGKASISKRGNKYLRKCLHMPALATIRGDKKCKAFYERLVSKHGIKMKAGVAVQRKVLELMYTLYKKNELYDRNYEGQNNQPKKERQLL